MTVTMLTTVDNPHSPFNDWDAWFKWDTEAGYNTSGLLARIAVVSHELSDKDFADAIEMAIDEIIKENVSGMHVKVSRSVSGTE